MTRRRTRRICAGALAIGGDAPVSVQTMATADPHDAAALVRQIESCAAAGADLVRLAVPDAKAAEVFKTVRAASPVPLSADIHFDWRLAIAAIDAGCDALRLNPGNIGSRERIAEIAHAAKERRVPIRIGVNAGSLEKDILQRHGAATAEALAESAMRHAGILEDEGFGDIAISVKASNVERTVAAYRMIAERTDCPLHLGVTEAGTFVPGTVRSSVALGILLSEGIGDTIRVSLTAKPEEETAVGLEILRAIGLRAPGPSVVSCPTCGRTKADVMGTAAAVEAALDRHMRETGAESLPRVAVMGCVVNGPGEAREADIALCGTGDGVFALYIRGDRTGRTIAAADAAQTVLRLVQQPQA